MWLFASSQVNRALPAMVLSVRRFDTMSGNTMWRTQIYGPFATKPRPGLNGSRIGGKCILTGYLDVKNTILGAADHGGSVSTIRDCVFD